MQTRNICVFVVTFLNKGGRICGFLTINFKVFNQKNRLYWCIFL